jgi:branched-chain amino acid transport system substrate-binding protein
MQEYKKSIVIFIYIAIFSLIIPSIFWLNSLSPERKQALIPFGKKIETKPLVPPSDPVETSEVSNLDIAKRISVGEKILIAADQNPDKQAAAQAFAAGNYRDAITKYDASLQMQRNDPEALIYQNNAKAIASNDFLKIAVSIPIGGNLNVAKEILRGVAQVQQEVNSHGGIKGQLLQVAIANDDNNPLTVKQIADHFSQDEKILGVVGHNSTEASIAAAPIYQQAGLVMISPTTVGSSLSDIGSYIFRTTPDTRSTADILARYAVESVRKRKVAICFATDAKASQSFKDAFEWSIFQAGGKVVETNCDFSQPDFDPVTVPSQAISSGADALLLAPSIYNVNQAIAVLQANKNRLPLLGNQTMYTYETLQQGAAEANGMILSVAWHSTANADRVFAQEAQSQWGGTIGWRTAMAYDATKAMVVGLQSPESKSESKLESKPSRQQLQATLANPDFAFTGTTGKVQFLPSGDRNLKGVLVKVESGNLSGVGYDFAPVKP